MRWPIRVQILLPFGGATVLLLGLVSLVNAYVAAQLVQERVRQQLDDIVGILRNTNFPLTAAVLRQTRGLSGAEFVVTNSAGRVLAATIDVGSHHHFAASDRAASPLGAPLVVRDQVYLHSSVARRYPGQADRSETLHILYPERSLHGARARAVAPPLLAGVAALCLIVVVSLVVASRVTGSIRRLQRQVQRIAGGDLSPLALPRRDDEFRDLARCMNTLADQLDQSKQAVRRAERLTLLGQLSGGLAHQLRNAITGTRMAVQLHQRKCREDAQSLDVALRQLSVTEDQLQQFLTVGQPQPLRKSWGDVRVALRAVREVAAPSCRHRKVDLRLVDDPRPLMMRADHSRLRQLFLNLVLNAMEAAGHGGWVRIESAAVAPAAVSVRVLDSGPGPPAELLPRIFEPFVSGKREGVGLGLAVARQVVEQHGGRIRCEHREATVFEVVLPTEAEDETPATPPTGTEPTSLPGG